MDGKKILLEWNKVTEEYNMKLANLQTYMQNAEGIKSKEEIMKHYNQETEELNKLQSKANKLMASYYALNFNKIISEKGHSRSA